MEWEERLIAMERGEKKRVNGSGALEVPAAATKNEETMCRSLFYFCMWAGSSCGLVPQAQLAASNTGRTPRAIFIIVCAPEDSGRESDRREGREGGGGLPPASPAAIGRKRRGHEERRRSVARFGVGGHILPCWPVASRVTRSSLFGPSAHQF